jgi:hypothetical protein
MIVSSAGRHITAQPCPWTCRSIRRRMGLEQADAAYRAASAASHFWVIVIIFDARVGFCAWGSCSENFPNWIPSIPIVVGVRL